jgi:hypothetical protein
MRLGTAIVLLALGAILAFAVDYDINGLDIQVIGWILMVVGALGIVLEMAIWGPRQRRVTRTDVSDPAGAPVRRSTTEETY